MNKPEQYLKQFGGIDQRFIDEAMPAPKRRTRFFRRRAPYWYSAALAVLCIFMLIMGFEALNTAIGAQNSENGVLAGAADSLYSDIRLGMTKADIEALFGRLTPDKADSRVLISKRFGSVFDGSFFTQFFSLNEQSELSSLNSAVELVCGVNCPEEQAFSAYIRSVRSLAEELVHSRGGDISQVSAALENNPKDFRITFIDAYGSQVLIEMHYLADKFDDPFSYLPLAGYEKTMQIYARGMIVIEE